MLLCPVPPNLSFVLSALQMALGNYSIVLVTLHTGSLMTVALFLTHYGGKSYAMKEWSREIQVSFQPVFSTAHQ